MSTSVTIDARSVSKWYGNVVAVNDVSLQVGPGITGLLGPNGAGKTTLLNLITGLASPSEGEVSVLGEPVRENPPLYRRIGFMPGHESLYEVLTARQFVELAAELHGLDPRGAARRPRVRVCRAVGRPAPVDGHLLQGDAPAHQAGGLSGT